jgi:hypothetical protein
MMRHILACAIALALPVFATGCAVDSSSDEEGVSTTTSQNLSDDDDEADANVNLDVVTKTKGAYKLTLSSLDTSGVLTGTTQKGATVNFTITSTTAYRAARLDSWIPVDPCRTAAQNFNDALTSPSSEVPVTSAIASYANLGCKARVHVIRATGAISAFRPIS